MSDVALIVQPISSDNRLVESLQLTDNVAETEGLAHAIDLEVALVHVQKVSKALPSTLFGKGTCDLIKGMVEDIEPHIIIVNAALSP
ncbi:MAG: hypothetical protein JKY11_05415, partial [Alphaproteobacteria bacterium]|nr:hypothetical protein [Alphaproteobacteria bacterium]